MTFEKKNLPKSQVQLDVQVPAEEFEVYRKDVVADLGKNMKMEGFREGHIPGAMIEKQAGEANILSGMAEYAINKVYQDILQSENIDVIGEPEVQILKIAAGNPLEFRVTVAVIPEVRIPDYKKTASQVQRKNVTIEEKEVEGALEWLQNSRKAEDGNTPELSDEFAQQLGGFKTLEDLKKSVEEGLQHEKEMQETERLRQEVLEKIAEKSEVEVPTLLIEREKAVLLNNVKQGVQQMMQISFEEYLQKNGKTEQELLDSFAKEAEDRVKRFLVLREIAKQEAIAVTEEEIEREANAILSHYKNTKAAQGEVDPKRLREYTEGVIRHEKTLEFLEQLTQPVVA